MQPSEEDQGQSVVLGSHSGLGFVAVHVGKVLKSLRQQQNFVQLSICCQTTQSYSLDLSEFNI